MGFIYPSSSAHATSVLFVCEKNGSLCLCVDFQGLNKITKKDRYPLPHISDLLDTPSHTKVNTKINLWHAYYLVCIADGDKWNTSFWTHYSSYKWLVMPFGLTNAPAAFQCFINTVFADLLDVCVIIYLDNILIYSTNMTFHKKHVQEVLQQLCTNSLFTKPEKYEFHTKSTKYFGYQLLLSGLTMFLEKMKSIQDWPEPQKIKDV